MNRVDEALQQFGPDALTAKLLRAIYAVVPYSPAFPDQRSTDDAVRALQPGATEADLARARDIAQSSPEVGDVLRMGRWIDTGDKGYAAVSSLFTAVAMFRGAGASALDNDTQQRNDAALKALALAYLVYKAYPGTLAQKAAAFRSSPAGQALAIYYATAEIALPFADNAAAQGGSFLSELFAREGAAQAASLAQMAGGQQAEEAKGMLTAITDQLQQVVTLAKGYVKPVTEAVTPYVPGAMQAADRAAGLAATAADVMPVYTLLAARLAAESAARRAAPPV
jgi:hypothetical protein